VIRSTGAGIHIDGAAGYGNYYGTYTNVRSGRNYNGGVFFGNGGSGWVIKSTDGSNRIGSNVFINPKAIFNKGHGFDIDWSQNTFIGLEAENNDTFGVNIDNTYSNTFFGGYTENNHENWATDNASDGTASESFNLTANSTGVMVFGGRHLGAMSGTTDKSGVFLLQDAGAYAPRLSAGELSLLGIKLRRTTPATLGADVNDYSPGEGTFFRLASDATRTITGLAATTGLDDGQVYVFINVGSNSIVIARENAGSTSANRIETGTGADITLLAKDAITLIYDNSATRWKVIFKTQNQSVATFAGGDATPGVAGGSYFLTAGTTAITDFDDGVVGQTITVKAKTSITITDGGDLELAGNFAMTTGDTITLTMLETGKWSEISRSDIA
jgi:hypothetical protein